MGSRARHGRGNQINAAAAGGMGVWGLAPGHASYSWPSFCVPSELLPLPTWPAHRLPPPAPSPPSDSLRPWTPLPTPQPGPTLFFVPATLKPPKKKTLPWFDYYACLDLVQKDLFFLFVSPLTFLCRIGVKASSLETRQG